MGESADATMFFGIVPTEDETWSSDFAKPWRLTGIDNDDEEFEDFDGDNAIDYVLGTYGKSYAERAAALDGCPVEFLRTGDAYNEPRYVLALKETVQDACEWDVARFEMKPEWFTRGYAMHATLVEWAEKLGIPEERRGTPGWFFFATYG